MTVVIKVGGSILGEGVSPSILSDIKNIVSNNKVIIVHGGGKEVTKMSERLGKPQEFIVSPKGIRSRYTDKETSLIYTMVMTGKINKEIVVALQKEGINAVGISGVDGSVLQAQRKKRLVIVDEEKRKRAIDGGYTGKITDVNVNILNLLLDSGITPIISPVAISEEHECLNVDGDRAASAIAGRIKSDSVLFLTDVPGILLNKKVIKNIKVSEAKKMMPEIGHGMEKKVIAAIESINMGTNEALISSGLINNPISSALNHEGCTVIVND